MEKIVMIIGLVVGLGYTIFAFCRPKKVCPDCGKPSPRIRIPDSKQLLQGGWTCANCGCRVDSKGNKQ